MQRSLKARHILVLLPLLRSIATGTALYTSARVERGRKSVKGDAVQSLILASVRLGKHSCDCPQASKRYAEQQYTAIAVS